MALVRMGGWGTSALVALLCFISASGDVLAADGSRAGDSGRYVRSFAPLPRVDKPPPARMSLVRWAEAVKAKRFRVACQGMSRRAWEGFDRSNALDFPVRRSERPCRETLELIRGRLLADGLHVGRRVFRREHECALRYGYEREGVAVEWRLETHRVAAQVLCRVADSGAWHVTHRIADSAVPD